MCKNGPSRGTSQDKGLRQKGPGMLEDSRRAVWLQGGDRGDSKRDRVRNQTGPDAAGKDFLCLYPGTNGKPLEGFRKSSDMITLV